VNLTSLATAPGGAYSTFAVTYADDTAIKISTIGDDDLLVTGPNGFSSLVTLVSTTSPNDGPLRGATYRVDAPGGVWDPSDNGTYTISMRGNEVSDTGNVFVAEGTLGTFEINLHDTTSPTATLSTPAPVNGSATTTFTITYSDNFAMKLSSLDSADIQITGPNSFSQTATFVGANQLTNTTSLIATYRINAPGGAWDALDSGTYTISMRAGQVSDISTLPVPTGSLGTFSVNIADTQAPTASVDAATLTAAAANYTFTITYSDNVAINLLTLDSSDITISGPNGFSASATYIGPNTTGNGSPRIATYRIAGPGGAWDLADNGEYFITLNNAQVADTTGNTVSAGVLASFSVAIADTAAPSASATAADLTSEGGSTYQFTITWGDNLLVNLSSLDSSDLVIVAPDSSLLPVTLVGADSDINASSITANRPCSPALS
jgi:hypothetical protein